MCRKKLLKLPFLVKLSTFLKFPKHIFIFPHSEYIFQIRGLQQLNDATCSKSVTKTPDFWGTYWLFQKQKKTIFYKSYYEYV